MAVDLETIEKGDCRVKVTPGTGKVEVRSTIESMYADQIRADASAVLAQYGNPSLDLLVEDAGALPFVIQGRVEAGISRALGSPLAALPAAPAALNRNRLRRTRLYLPGSRPRFFVNGSLASADMVILDLEDSVPADQKVDALCIVRRTISAMDWEGAEVAVRLNQGAQGLQEAKALAKSGAHLFLVPKAESPAYLRELDEILEGERSDCGFFLLVESALGLELIFDLFTATPRNWCASLGLEDLLEEYGATRTVGGSESAWAQGRLLNACRATGTQPLASVCPIVDDEDALESYAKAAMAMGFEGVGCIHPSQVAVVHRAMHPTESEISWANQVVKSVSDEVSVAVVDGKMVDAPALRKAKKILARAVIS